MFSHNNIQIINMLNTLGIPNFKPNTEPIVWELDLGFRKNFYFLTHSTAQLSPYRLGEKGCMYIPIQGML